MSPTEGTRRVRIRDVADAAGVSPTTVSHVFNGARTVNAQTREHVLEVAARLHYRPSRTARSLRTSRTETLGLILPSFDLDREADVLATASEHYLRLTEAATRSAIARGYRLFLAPAITSVAAANDLDVEGVLICDPGRDDPQLAFLDAAGLPWVTHEPVPGRPEHRRHVNSDLALDVTRVLDHLVAAGGTRVGLVSLDLRVPFRGTIEETYVAWCRERGMAPQIVAVDPGAAPDVADEHVATMFDTVNPPDAVLDVAPPTVLRACRRRGMEVPADVLVAAFADSGITRAADPPLTAIDLNAATVGSEAIGLLIDLLEGREPASPIIVPTTLNVRRSSSRPAAVAAAGPDDERPAYG